MLACENVLAEHIDGESSAYLPMHTRTHFAVHTSSYLRLFDSKLGKVGVSGMKS